MYDRMHDELLPLVEKPSRYLGSELNSVHKDLSSVDVRIGLVFPDLYDLGLSNLGILILYSILNKLPGVWAERAYAPAMDLEAELRARGWPLFSLESKTPLAEFDALGFTLQYELGFTNILNMLDLSGIPLLVQEREERHPLILAGGPCAFNPEPLAPFVDGVLLGDGEDAVRDLVRMIRETRGMRRHRRLEALAEIEGMYVPSLYPTVTGPDGTILPDPAAGPVRKRVLRDLDTAPFPTDYIVPFTPQVHDRVSLEVLRGCTQACRFCQAGMIYRPVRERSIETLGGLMEETISKTGYEEIALSSLSTCDYSRVKGLVDEAVKRSLPDHVAVSLPSMRTDSFSVDLAEMLQSVRRTGLTFAPEAATDRMRRVIDKYIPDDEVLRTTSEVFARGWERVKLYFMIGLPTEMDEDVLAIGRLARDVLGRGRVFNKRARVNLGVSTFVPKPHTPFQWDQQISIEETFYKQKLLRDATRVFGLKFGNHDAEMSYLEGVFSRGDRRVGDLLLHAFREGCTFDAWGEHFDFAKWRRAFERWGIDPDSYLRERALEEPLPWDHIDSLVDKQYFIDEWRKSREASLTRDCRYDKCHHCGVIDEEKQGCLTMLKTSRQGQKAEITWQRPRRPKPTFPEPVQRLRFRWVRRGDLRYLSHLETLTAWNRALRRAGVPVAYSQGFHPKPRFSFGSALPVGVSSEGEYADALLIEAWEPAVFVERLNATLPEGLSVCGAWEAPLRTRALMASIVACDYALEVPHPLCNGCGPTLQERVNALLAREALFVERTTKKGKKQLDIRPFIAHLGIECIGPQGATLRLRLLIREGGSARPSDVLAALWTEGGGSVVGVRKLESLVDIEGALVPVVDTGREVSPALAEVG
jgi:radical SAM family uncharacterized protein/radical SAM-linked protein